MAVRNTIRARVPVEPPSVNGNGRYHSPFSVQASALRRVEIVLRPKFDEDAADKYPSDWEFLFWRNHPMHFRRKLFGDAESNVDIFEALKELVPAHNGWTWTDRDGNERPFPPTGEDAFWDMLPQDVLVAMHRAITEELAGPLPNSPTTTSETSPSTSSSSTTAEAQPETLSPGLTSGVN